MSDVSAETERQNPKVHTATPWEAAQMEKLASEIEMRMEACPLHWVGTKRKLQVALNSIRWQLRFEERMR